MPSVAYLRQLQRLFSHFKKNGGRNRPACCLQIELVDDVTTWYVQLLYKRPPAAAAVHGEEGGGREGGEEEEELIVNIKLCFTDGGDDAAERGEDAAAPGAGRSSQMPLVFIQSPRLIAPFIHFGALCSLELMSQTGWAPTPLNMELFLIALHDTLNPFTRGSSVQVLPSGVGRGGLDAAAPATTAAATWYSAEEHEDGIRHIRRCHPHLFRGTAALGAGAAAAAVVAVGEDGPRPTTPQPPPQSQPIRRLTDTRAVSHFVLDGVRTHMTARRQPPREGVETAAATAATSVYAAVIDEAAVVAELDSGAGGAGSSLSVLAEPPLTQCRRRALAYCSQCPRPHNQPHHVLPLYMHLRENAADDRSVGETLPLRFELSASAPSPPTSPSPSSSPAPSSSLQSKKLALLLQRGLPPSADSAAAAPTAPPSTAPATCVVAHGHSITLRDVFVYGHLRVLGSLAMHNCTFVGSIVAEGHGHVSLRGCDVALAVQDELLSPHEKGEAAVTPPAAARPDGILVLDNAVVEVLEGTVVSRAVPWFEPQCQRAAPSSPDESAENATASTGGSGPEQTSSSDGDAQKGRAGRRRQRQRRPHFSLRHTKTAEEEAAERLPLMRGLFVVSNSARLCIADSVVTPLHVAHCDYAIFAEGDAAVDLHNTVLAAGGRGALTLQGCRGHCERVWVTVPAVLLHATHLSIHRDGDAGDGQWWADLPGRLCPTVTQQRRHTGIDVQLGGAVTARHCVAECVYFGYAAVAQSVASFHGCHARHVVNGFTIDSSKASLGRCSTEARKVGLFVLQQGKCDVLCGDDRGDDAEDGEAIHDDDDAGAGAGGAASRDGATASGYALRCAILKHITSAAVAAERTAAAPAPAAVAVAELAAIRDFLLRYRQSCPSYHDAAARILRRANSPSSQPLPPSSSDVDESVRVDACPVVFAVDAPLLGGRRRTRHALAAALAYTAAMPADMAFPIDNPFCVFAGGENGAEVLGAVLHASGAVFAGPRDAGLSLLSNGAVQLSRSVLWRPKWKATAAPPPADGRDGGEAAAGAERTATDSDDTDATEAGVDDGATGLAAVSATTVSAVDCLSVGYPIAFFLDTAATATLVRCMAADCERGYSILRGATAKLRHCGAAATRNGVLVYKGGHASIVGVPHAVADCAAISSSGAAPSPSPAAAAAAAAASATAPRRAICGGNYLSVYEGGGTAIECQRSSMSCVGVVISRADAYGIVVSFGSTATLEKCFIDGSPRDAAQFLGKAYRRAGAADSVDVRLLEEAALSRLALPARSAQTVGVHVVTGGRCTATEVEVRYANIAFWTRGPETRLTAHRCRARHVEWGFYSEEGSAAAMHHCRCHAVHGVVALTNARCTIASGAYSAKRVGLDVVGSYLRVEGHVRVTGSARVGVRLMQESYLEAVDPPEGAAAASRGCRPGAAIVTAKKQQQQQQQRPPVRPGERTRLEVTLSSPLGRSAGRSGGDLAELLARPDNLDGRGVRPVCFLMQGKCSATVHGGSFSGAPSPGGECGVHYGLRAEDGATAQFSSCRFEACEGAAVCVSGGARVTLLSCHLRGRGGGEGGAADAADAEGGMNINYALVVRHGGHCRISGGPTGSDSSGGGGLDPRAAYGGIPLFPSSGVRRSFIAPCLHPTYWYGSLPHRRLHALQRCLRRGVEAAAWLLRALWAFALRRRLTQRQWNVAGVAGGAPVWARRLYTLAELRGLAWMSHRCQSAAAVLADGASIVEGRCLVHGVCRVERTAVVALARRAAGSAEADAVADAVVSPQSATVDVAVGGSFTASQTFFLVAPATAAAAGDHAFPLVHARHPSSRVVLTTCLVTPLWGQPGGGDDAAPPATAARHLLHLGAGATGELNFIASAARPEEAVWPSPAADAAAAAAAAPLPLFVHVSRGSTLRVDGCRLRRIQPAAEEGVMGHGGVYVAPAPAVSLQYSRLDCAEEAGRGDGEGDVVCLCVGGRQVRLSVDSCEFFPSATGGV